MTTAVKAKDDLFFTAHFESFLITEKRVSKNTLAAYMSDIKQFCEFLRNAKSSIAACTPELIKRFVHFLTKSGAKPRSLARKVSSLKLLYSLLSEQFGMHNCAEILIFPKIEKTLPVYLTEEEISRLFVAAEEDESIKGVRNLVMLNLLYATGMRITELVTLKLDQIHLDTGFVQVNGKGNKQRDIPIPQTTQELLSLYINEIHSQIVPEKLQSKNTQFVFPLVRQGKVKNLTRQSFWMLLKKLLIEASITKNVSPHTLRHSLATHMLKNGADIRSLQMILGHEQVNTVEIYTHLENKQVRSVYDKKHPRA